MGVPWVYRNTFNLLVPHLFQILPLPRPKNLSTNSPILLKHGPIDCICHTDSKNMHVMVAKCPQGLCTLHARCAKRAWSGHGPCRVLLELGRQMQSFGTCFKKIRDKLWRNIFFQQRAPLFVFGLFVEKFFGQGRGKDFKQAGTCISCEDLSVYKE